MESARRLSIVRFMARALMYRFTTHRVTDLAAAMTFYLVLSVFPLLVAVVSIVSLVGGVSWLLPRMEEMVAAVASPEITRAFGELIGGFLSSEGAGLALVVSLLAALWSASGYLGAFTRAVNTVYQVGEGRNFVKLKAIQLVMTVALVVVIVLLLIALAVSATAANWLGHFMGAGDQLAAIWSWLRFPLMGVAVIVIVQLLYFVAPNVRQSRVRFLSPGAVTAIVLAAGVVGLFRVYLAVFHGASNYAKTYGALAGVIIVLFLAFLVNVALLIGAELDAILERVRQMRSGLPMDWSLLLPPRDDTGIVKAADAWRQLVEQGEAIRLNSGGS